MSTPEPIVMPVLIRPLSRSTTRSCSLSVPLGHAQCVADACRRYGLVVQSWGVNLLVSASPTLVKHALDTEGIACQITTGLAHSRDVAA